MAGLPFKKSFPHSNNTALSSKVVSYCSSSTLGRKIMEINNQGVEEIFGIAYLSSGARYLSLGGRKVSMRSSLNAH